MTRVLTFRADDPKNDKRFEMLESAIHCMGDKSEKRSRDVIRSEARMLTALRSISEPKTADGERHVVVCSNCGANLDAKHNGLDAVRELRVLRPGEQRLELSAEDYKRLDAYLETTPWLPALAEAAVDTWDWFSAAEKVEG